VNGYHRNTHSWGRNHSKKLYPNLLKYQYTVPLFVWCSDRYMKENPDVVRRIRDARNRSFSLDNISHMLYYLGGIGAPYYKPKRNILDSVYCCPPRIVNDSILYDSMI